MMKTAFLAFVAAHGAIHLLGFMRAIGLVHVEIFEGPSSFSLGLLWLFAALGFFTSALLLARSSRDWPIAAAPAVLLSQILILTSWTDAKWGTIANLVILVPALILLVVASRTSSDSRQPLAT